MLQMQSTVTADGHAELTVAEVPDPTPGANEVLIRVEAAPINPSDLGLLFSGADMTTAEAIESGVRGRVPSEAMPMMAPRIGRSLPCGNEGAGVVVGAGDDAAAQALVGKTVATLGGSMYSQFKVAAADQCLVLPDDVTPAEGASCFVNPLTVLGMIGTMRREGHTALAHTAAASNLGQMLQKVCIDEGIPLVNIVRRQEHVDLLRGLGAEHVVNMRADSYHDDLTAALAATGATLAFDATGGGRLASDLLTCMERALARSGGAGNRYGTSTHKQVYIYGGLERGPTTLDRSYGMAWGLGGWLLPIYLARGGTEESEKLRQRVAAEIKTTFASGYSKVVSLKEAVSLEAVGVYGRQATGEKYLIAPQL